MIHYHFSNFKYGVYLGIPLTKILQGAVLSEAKVFHHVNCVINHQLLKRSVSRPLPFPLRVKSESPERPLLRRRFLAALLLLVTSRSPERWGVAGSRLWSCIAVGVRPSGFRVCLLTTVASSPVMAGVNKSAPDLSPVIDLCAWSSCRGRRDGGGVLSGFCSPAPPSWQCVLRRCC
jgi:hypothetical protein